MSSLNNLLRRVPRTVLLFVSQILTWTLWHGGNDPDVILPAIAYLPIIFSLISILVIVESAGVLLESRFPSLWPEFESFSLRIALGIFGIGSLVLVMGFIGIIGDAFWLVYLVLSLSVVTVADFFAVNASVPVYTFGFWRPRWERYYPALLVLLGVSLLALFPSIHPDPLYYHLRASKHWFTIGEITFDPSFPSLFLSGFWESMYLFAMHLLPTNINRGQIEIQILGQLLHLTVGACAAIPVMYRVIQGIFQFGKERIHFVVAASLVCLPLLSTVYVAKNDWGALLFCFSAILLLTRLLKSNSGEFSFLFGLFTGVASAIKITQMLFVFLLSLALLVHSRISISKVFSIARIAVFGFLLGMICILYRNFYFTGVPIFPIGAYDLFSATDKLTFEAFSSYPGKMPAQLYISHFLRLLLLIPILPLAVLVFLRRDKKVKFVCMACFVAFFYFYFFVNPVVNWRLTGMLIPFLISLSFVGFYGFLERFTKTPKIATVLSILLVLLVGFSSKSIQDVYKNLSHLDNPSLMIRYQYAGESMAWFRMQEEDPGLIYFAGVISLYYMEGFNTRTIESDPEIDKALTEAKTAEERVKVMHSLGAKYFVETYLDMPWGTTTLLIYPIINRCRECVVFAGKGSRVVSVAKLYEFIQQENYVPEKPKNIKMVIPEQK